MMRSICNIQAFLWQAFVEEEGECVKEEATFVVVDEEGTFGKEASSLEEREFAEEGEFRRKTEFRCTKWVYHLFLVQETLVHNVFGTPRYLFSVVLILR